MLGFGVTRLIRCGDYASRRRVHFGRAIATVALTIVHMLLDGVNFGEVPQAVGWEDPLLPDMPQG